MTAPFDSLRLAVDGAALIIGLLLAWAASKLPATTAAGGKVSHITEATV